MSEIICRDCRHTEAQHGNQGCERCNCNLSTYQLLSMALFSRDATIEKLAKALGAINHMIVGRWLAVDITAAIKKISFDALQGLPDDTDLKVRIQQVNEYREIEASAIKAVHKSFGEAA